LDNEKVSKVSKECFSGRLLGDLGLVLGRQLLVRPPCALEERLDHGLVAPELVAALGPCEHRRDVLRRLEELEEHVGPRAPARDVAVRVLSVLAVGHAALLTNVVGHGGLRRSLLGVDQVGDLTVEAGAAPVALGERRSGGRHLGRR
jgi:hypothetical protein